MTSAPTSQPRAPRPLVYRFPSPKTVVRLAYADLDRAAYGSEEERGTVGDPADLPRPWDPASCTDPDLRLAVWMWLEEVVAWLNQEYSWNVVGLIPTCWTNHPHLVHEIAVVADQRRRAGAQVTSDALEEWHRYCLPAFTDRMVGRLRTTCDDRHVGWPARSRHLQHISAGETERREDAYARDVDALARPAPWPPPLPPNRLNSPGSAFATAGQPSQPPGDSSGRRFTVVDRASAGEPGTGEFRDDAENDEEHRDPNNW